MSGASHVFSEIYLHVNWHCLSDQPLITPTIESPLHKFLEEYCRKVKGVHFEGLGGIDTHVHLAFRMEPFVLLSDFLGKIKGASSHEMNRQFGPTTLQWQRGYGVVSFAKRNLPAVLRYVASQKEHHRRGTLNTVLELTDENAEES